MVKINQNMEKDRRFEKVQEVQQRPVVALCGYRFNDWNSVKKIIIKILNKVDWRGFLSLNLQLGQQSACLFKNLSAILLQWKTERYF